MMKPRRLSTTLAVVVVVLACAALWAGVGAQQKPAAAPASTSADALLGAALHQEEVAGQLEAAIATYRKVLVAADATRAQKAKAQLRIGACYERLGNGEATKAYEAVLRDYADQTDAASQARARLAGLGVAGGTATSLPGQFTLRELSAILPPRADASGSPVSPDGRYVAYEDGDTGDLAVLDLHSGTTRRLSNVPEPRRWTDEMGGSVAWSPDSSRVASEWSLDDGKRNEIRVYALAGGEPQVLVADAKVSFSPEDWAADGRILVVTWTERERGIAWLSPGAQVPQTVKVISADVGMPSPRVSPGGQFIAYLAWNPAVRRRSLRVMRSDGSGDGALLDLANPDQFIGWTPGAGGVLLVRAGSGARGADALWLQRIDAAGKAAGDAVVLRDEFPDADVLGLSRAGALFFTHQSGSAGLYIADLDPASGAVAGRPTRFSASSESVIWGPGWSPDGTLLAFGTSQAHAPSHTLTVRTVDGRSSRQLSLPSAPSPIVPPQWLPDSRSVAFVARPKGPDAGIYRVDVNSGQVNTMLEPGTGILLSPPSDKEPNSNLGALSPDGRVAFVRHYRYGADGKQIPALIAHPLDGGASTKLFEGEPPGGISSVAVSPDGLQVAFSIGGAIRVVPAKGGNARVVCQGGTGRALAWSADSRALLTLSLGQPAGDGTRTAQLVRCLVDDGKVDRMELVGVETEYVGQLAVNPNGTQIAFAVSAPMRPANVWVLENFLPKSGAKGGK